MNYVLQVEVNSVDLRCDHCASWSAEAWSHVQTFIDELQRQHDPNDRLIPISEYLSDVSCKHKQT